MKTLITAILIVSAHSAAATGFSPWTEHRLSDSDVTITSVEVAAPGFGPWRERHVTDEIRIKPQTGIVTNDRELNIFRPWS
ncbi:MAG: hypothetical protein ACU85U_05910 [Gammaproteobacteria bacterium]|jgi:hypothetical protein